MSLYEGRAVLFDFSCLLLLCLCSQFELSFKGFHQILGNLKDQIWGNDFMRKAVFKQAISSQKHKINNEFILNQDVKIWTFLSTFLHDILPRFRGFPKFCFFKFP